MLNLLTSVIPALPPLALQGYALVQPYETQTQHNSLNIDRMVRQTINVTFSGVERHQKKFGYKS